MSMSMLDQVAEPAVAADEYWLSAQRPLSCLVFLLPLVAVYEFGVLYLGRSHADTLRNGADYWMRSWLALAGIPGGVVLPFCLLGLLLMWHVASRHPWRLEGRTMIGMLAESVLFACSLVALARLHEILFHGLVAAPLFVANEQMAVRAVSFVGAGVYEELLFRLCLVPVLYGAARLFQLSRRSAAVTSVLLTSLIFALAHYVGPGADGFTLYSFSFRALAGAFF